VTALNAYSHPTVDLARSNHPALRGRDSRFERRRRDRAARAQRVDQLPVHPAIAASRERTA
jgi:hypothetical protein